MTRLRLTGLGVALATAGGSRAWVRLGSMAAGFALGAALLLAAVSIPQALDARDAREYARFGSKAPGHDTTGDLRIWQATQRYGSLEFTAWTVEGADTSPVPPGLPRVPEPGEIFVSPALAERWTGPTAERLEHRLGGAVVGTISPEGVVGPDELFAWVGASDAAALPRRAAWVVDTFDVSAQEAPPIGLGALLMLVGLTSAILLPIWLFVATATRLSAATREARLAAVRLAGGTQGQVRFLAAVEVGVAAALGVLCGVPLFLAARPLLSGGLVLGRPFFPEDFAPSALWAAAILIGVPVLAVAMSVAAIRRLEVSPLGVARGARRTHAGRRWAYVLAGGVALLAWLASRHDDVMAWGQTEAALLVGVGLVAIAFGLIGTASWTAWLFARHVAGRARSVGTLLGMRRLDADPSSVGRVVGGVALVIAVAGVLHAAFVSVEQESGRTFVPRWLEQVGDDTVVAHTDFRWVAPTLSQLRDVPGVGSLEITRRSPWGGVTSPPLTAILGTDGAPATIEEIRDRAPWGIEIMSASDWRRRLYAIGPASEYEAVRRGLMVLSLFLIAVNGATLMVAMVDWVIERRRALAALSAVGVPAGVIRRSILAQVVVPLATSVLFGVVGAITVIVLLFRAIETHVVMPAPQLAAWAAASIAVVLVVTAAAMPWVTATRRPELLRSE